ncbi:MAG: hypothetical protein QOD73_1448 [Solirubrobacteraceae bacterium]|jgi:hypothetical protein|nr:hypothetical protein [Solirubrobacteraceae bacterium]
MSRIDSLADRRAVPDLVLRQGSRGAALLAALAVLAVGIVLALTLSGGDRPGPAAPAASSTQPTQAQQQAKVEAEIGLTPPPARKDSKGVGIVLIQRTQGRRQLVAAVQGLPRPPAGGYGIWLYTSAAKARWLGFFASRDAKGRLLARGELTAPIEDYREVLVTRESRGGPGRPGPVFLRGRIPRPARASG